MNKLGIIITAILFFNLSIIFAQESKNEFEGIIEYEIKIGDKNSNKEKNYASTGTKQILFYKKGKIRTDFYIDSVLIKSIYSYTNIDTSYLKFADDKNIYKYRINSNYKSQKESNKINILNYSCKSISLTDSPRNLVEFIFFYSPDLLIDIDTNSAPLPYSLTKSLLLKSINKSENRDSIVQTAIRIKETNLNDSIFKIDKTNITTTQLPYSFNYTELGNYFFKCKNYKNAIFCYEKAEISNNYLFVEKGEERNQFYSLVESTYNEIRFNKAVTYLKMNKNYLACKELGLIRSKKDKESHKLYEQYCSCNSLTPYYKKEINNSLLNREYDKIIELCDKTLECNKNDTSILFIKGISNYNKKAFLEAYNSFITAKDNGSIRAKEFINNDFNKTQLLIIYNKKGDKYFKNKEYKKASNYYTLVLEKVNNSPSVLRKRGLSEIKLDNKTKGCLDLKRALENDDEEAEKLYKKHCKRAP